MTRSASTDVDFFLAGVAGRGFTAEYWRRILTRLQATTIVPDPLRRFLPTARRRRWVSRRTSTSRTCPMRSPRSAPNSTLPRCRCSDGRGLPPGPGRGGARRGRPGRARRCEAMRPPGPGRARRAGRGDARPGRAGPGRTRPGGRGDEPQFTAEGWRPNAKVPGRAPPPEPSAPTHARPRARHPPGPRAPRAAPARHPLALLWYTPHLGWSLRARQPRMAPQRLRQRR